MKPQTWQERLFKQFKPYGELGTMIDNGNVDALIKHFSLELKRAREEGSRGDYGRKMFQNGFREGIEEAIGAICAIPIKIANDDVLLEFRQKSLAALK